MVLWSVLSSVVLGLCMDHVLIAARPCGQSRCVCASVSWFILDVSIGVMFSNVCGESCRWAPPYSSAQYASLALMDSASCGGNCSPKACWFAGLRKEDPTEHCSCTCC
ncbi:hypothetical protein CPB85DRAFT_1307165 [Mucidula mucida]|nr:hypothetical protein CPB85DRAFT_1307165 [Mucidula mucida]